MADNGSEYQVIGVDEELIDRISRRLVASITVGTLESHLLASAARSAETALMTLGDWTKSAFHAGQSLEHLAKAIIVAEKPEGLTLPKKSASVDFLRGSGHPQVDHVAQIYTIPGPQAVEAAFSFSGLSAPDTADLKLAFEARNAAAHLGIVDPMTAPGCIGGSIRLILRLLAPKGLTLGAWLGDPDLQDVAVLLARLPQGHESYALSVESRVRAKLWVAKQEWAQLRERLPAEVVLTLGAARPTDPGWVDERELRECPTGGHLAWRIVLWELDDTQENGDPERLRDEVGRLGGIDCPLCGLDLSDEDVWTVGLAQVIEYRTVAR